MHKPRSYYFSVAALVVALSAFMHCPGWANEPDGSQASRPSSLAGSNAAGGWTVRVITEAELEAIAKRDPDMSPSVALRILAKLNERDFDYIHEDIRKGAPLRVPRDFAAFRDWTPLPRSIPEVADLSRFILIVKNPPHIGWYAHGKLAGTTYICIGRQDSWTRAGLYSVLEKDRTHVSRSYPNAYGEPAPMPWALRVYEHVWIHAGDITKGYCSHGCINLPIFPAMHLFEWAVRGTPVLIVNALREVRPVLAANRASCTLRASLCGRRTPEKS